MAKAKKKKTSSKSTTTAQKTLPKAERVKPSSTVWGVIPSGFKRMGISYDGKSITFKVNPREYDITRQTRQAVYKTQNSVVIQQFGSDLAEIVITGSTGWHKDGNGLNGQERVEEINKLVAKYQNDTQNGGHAAKEFKFNNYTDKKYYTVAVAKFNEHRDSSTPVLTDYTLQMTVVAGDDTPTQDTALTAVVGTGSGSSISKGTDVASNSVSSAQQHLVNTATDPHATKQAIKKATKRLKKKHGK